MDHDGFFFAGLAGENADSARSWKEYARKLEAENAKLKGDVMEWQVMAVQVGARGLAREEIIQSALGKGSYEAAGGEPVFMQLVEKLRPVVKERMGADLA
jgi:hypothetical protein